MNIPCCLNLLYTKPFIYLEKIKPKIIHNRNCFQTAINTDNITLSHKHIILPNNSSSNFIEKNQNKPDIKTVFSKTIPDLLHSCEYIYIYIYILGGAPGAVVIVVGNGQGDTSPKPGRAW